MSGMTNCLKIYPGQWTPKSSFAAYQSLSAGFCVGQVDHVPHIGKEANKSKCLFCSHEIHFSFLAHIV